MSLVTIWGYELSYLEFIAVITSIIAVSLGITGKRITWPWWAISSVLYGILFLQWELFASAALQSSLSLPQYLGGLAGSQLVLNLARLKINIALQHLPQLFWQLWRLLQS
jgi:nicotinamide riboside transporter PnuC